MNQQKRAARGSKNSQNIPNTIVTIAAVADNLVSSCIATAAPGIEIIKFKKRSKV